MSKILASGWVENNLDWGRIYITTQDQRQYFLATCGYETSPPNVVGPPGTYRLWSFKDSSMTIHGHSHDHDKLTARYNLPPLFEDSKAEVKE